MQLFVFQTLINNIEGFEGLFDHRTHPDAKVKVWSAPVQGFDLTKDLEELFAARGQEDTQILILLSEKRAHIATIEESLHLPGTLRVVRCNELWHEIRDMSVEELRGLLEQF